MSAKKGAASMRGLKPCMIIVAALGGLSAARGADLRCDTPGVAQLVIADTFAQDPSAKKLGLEVTGVTMLGVDESEVGNPVCLVSVETDRGHSLRYKFRFSAEGTASLDLAP
jgi:hypothetical protein